MGLLALGGGTQREHTSLVWPPNTWEFLGEVPPEKSQGPGVSSKDL